METVNKKPHLDKSNQAETPIIIDASNTVTGRLASVCAKELLKGKTIAIVNAQNAVISGEPKYIFEKYTEKRERGDPYHGPFYPKEPDQIIKRVIRGMLPYKKGRGIDAFSRIKVYISIPEEFKEKTITKIKGTKNDLDCKTMTVGELAIKLGAKKKW